MTKALNLHKYLSLWRESRGLSQEKVATILCVNKSTISRWEKGERQVDLGDLQRLAAIYEVDPVALLLAPDDVALAKRLTRAKRVLDGASDRLAETWLDGGDQMRGFASD